MVGEPPAPDELILDAGPKGLHQLGTLLAGRRENLGHRCQRHVDAA